VVVTGLHVGGEFSDCSCAMGGQLICEAEACHMPRQWSADGTMFAGVQESQTELCHAMCGPNAQGSRATYRTPVVHGGQYWEPPVDTEADVHFDLGNHGWEVQWTEPMDVEEKQNQATRNSRLNSMDVGLESPSKQPNHNAPMKEVVRPNDKDEFLHRPPQRVLFDAEEPSPEPDVQRWNESPEAEFHQEKTIAKSLEPPLQASKGTCFNLASEGVTTASNEKEEETADVKAAEDGTVRSLSSSGSSRSIGSDNKSSAQPPQRRQEHAEAVTTTTPEAIAEGSIGVRGCSLPDDVGVCATDLSKADCKNKALNCHTSETTLPAVSEVNAGGDEHVQTHCSLGLERHGSIVRAMPTESHGLQLYHISATNAAGAETLRLARRSAKTSSTWREDVNSSHEMRAASLERASNKQQRRMRGKAASMESLHPEPVSSKKAPATAHQPKKNSHSGQQHGTEREGRSGRSRRPLSERRRADELLLW